MISQREARRLMKRVAALEGQLKSQRRVWSQEYIGAEIARVDLSSLPREMSAVLTARKLGHAVVVIAESHNVVRFQALPHPSESV